MKRFVATLLALTAIVTLACSSSAEGREIDIEVEPEACAPATVAVTPGEAITFNVNNHANADREFEGIEGTRIEEVLVPDGRTRHIDYTVPDATDATYLVKCYSPDGPTTIIELVAGEGSAAVDPSAATASIDVALAEWSVTPSAPSVEAGTVRFVAHNESETMTHELAILAIGENGERFEIAEVEGLEPGQSGEVVATLEPGTYQLACLIAPGEAGSTEDHYASGMHTEFTVE
ncbi:MAG: cupredoxin domain-containing protein [Dehalococcoidia bacterium]